MSDVSTRLRSLNAFRLVAALLAQRSAAAVPGREAEEGATDQFAVGRDRVAGAEPGVGEEPPPVHRDGGEDAGGTVRRRGDDPAARGVLLVDRERERAEPFAGDLASAFGFNALELLADHSRATLDLEDAWEHTVRVQAGVHASGHRVPDGVEACGELFFRAHREFVLPRDIGDREAVLIAECEQRGRVGVAERQGSGGDLRVFSLTPDEAAADRVVRLFSESVPVDPERSERHGIRMPRQPRARSELDVVLLERDRVRPIDEQRRAGGKVRPSRAHLGGGAGLGGESAQACDDSIRCAVPDAGRSERAVQGARHPSHLAERTTRAQASGEVQRRAHRSDGVRARRPHPDGEEVESRDVRSHMSRLRPASRPSPRSAPD